MQKGKIKDLRRSDGALLVELESGQEIWVESIHRLPGTEVGHTVEMEKQNKGLYRVWVIKGKLDT